MKNNLYYKKPVKGRIYYEVSVYLNKYHPLVPGPIVRILVQASTRENAIKKFLGEFAEFNNNNFLIGADNKVQT